MEKSRVENDANEEEEEEDEIPAKKSKIEGITSQHQY